jgi:hypothetical protein
MNRPRVFRDPGAGRLLYRRRDRRAGRPGFDFAGYLYTDCPDCGLVHATRDPRGRELKECSLCGASLSQSRV